MPTLEEIIELGTAAGERAILTSKLMDLAWMSDRVAIAKGQPAHHLHDMIERMYAETIGAFDGGSNG